MPQLTSPFITKKIVLASGESQMVEVEHYQVKFLQLVTQQANSVDYLFVTYGQDPAELEADASLTPPLPDQVGVFELGDVFYIQNLPEGAASTPTKRAFIYVMRPADGVSGNNTYLLMFTRSDQAQLLVNPANVPDECCQGTQELFYRSDAAGTFSYSKTIDTNNFPGMKSITAHVLLALVTGSTAAITVQGFSDAAATHETFENTYNADITDPLSYLYFGPAYAGMKAGLGSCLDVFPTDLPRILKFFVVLSGGVSADSTVLVWGR